MQRGNRRFRLVLTVFVMVTLAAGACGGAAETSAPPATSAPGATAPAATSPPTTQDKAADEDHAKAALITVDDLPGDAWLIDRSGEDEDDSWSSVIESCTVVTPELKEVLSRADKAPAASSPALSDQEDGRTILNKVSVFATVEDAQDLGTALASPELLACMKERLLRSYQENGLTIPDTAVSVTVEETEAFGDEQIIFRTSATYDPRALDPEAPASVTDHDLFGLVRVDRGWTSVDQFTPTRLKLDAAASTIRLAADKLKARLGSV